MYVGLRVGIYSGEHVQNNVNRTTKGSLTHYHYAYKSTFWLCCISEARQLAQNNNFTQTSIILTAPSFLYIAPQ